MDEHVKERIDPVSGVWSTEVLVFGQLTEKVGGTVLSVDGARDTDQLKSLLLERYPTLGQGRFTIALNQKTIHQNTVLSPGDTIALLPPFSGG